MRGFKDSLTHNGEPSSIAEHATRYTEDAPAAPAVVPVVVPAAAPADEGQKPTPLQPAA